MKTRLARSLAILRRVPWLALLTLPVFLWPGILLVRDLCDPALGAPGIPARARELHAALGPRIASWARERVASRRAADAPLHDVPTTEWPMFTTVFYLLATDALVTDWEEHGRQGPSPAVAAHDAVVASKALLLDPSHHTWVRTHWGPGYLHHENVFFRGLIISGLTSYERITRDGTALPILRDQVESLSAELDASRLGVLDDYPGECYPIDVLVTVAFIRRADSVLGTDHSAFVERSRRAFEGPMTDALGLVPFRMDLPSGAQVQPSRGVGNSWVLAFEPELYGVEHARDSYSRYEAHFYDRRSWAEGFREYARTDHDDPALDFEIDAGPIVSGFGTAASAFGIAAARRNGRFDHAYALSAELSTAAWTLPDGTLLMPRAASHGSDAPYLGEAAIAYFLTTQPAPGVAITPPGPVPVAAWIGLSVFFGVPALAWGERGLRVWRARRRSAPERAPGALAAA